jgi:hypothetical protein
LAIISGEEPPSAGFRPIGGFDRHRETRDIEKPGGYDGVFNGERPISNKGERRV